MHKQYRLAQAVLALAACGVFGHALAADGAAPVQSQPDFRNAINSQARTDEDRKEDDKRHPAEFLAFAKVHPGMKVLDLAAGGGTTSALLAAAVAPGGEVWAQRPLPKPGMKANPKMEARLASGKVPNLHVLESAIENPATGALPPLDLVVINMNYHDVVNAPVDRTAMNKHIYDALKPGGYYVVIDNSAKAGTGLSATKTLHRIDEATVVDEVTKAGFKVDGKSDYLRAPSDPREQPFYEMKGAPDDKFAIRFVK
ncbi:MAG: class I SAM-dependent methyltransferase [Telluria sp.]